MQLEELKQRIRAIKSMDDARQLRREIGPSAEETALQEQRLATLDALVDVCQFGEMYPGGEAMSARKKHDRILRQCLDEYESIYL